jgi:hypothetical protein
MTVDDSDEGPDKGADEVDEPAHEKQSLEQWRSYVAGIPEAELFDVTQRANTVAFVRGMQEQGYEAQEIHDVLVLFARRFQELGQIPPRGGYVDLEWLARQ